MATSSCTGGEPPTFFIDIAVPRDVDPEMNKLDGIFVYDIDDLQQVAAAHMEERSRGGDRRGDADCRGGGALARSDTVSNTLLGVLNWVTRSLLPTKELLTISKNTTRKLLTWGWDLTDLSGCRKEHSIVMNPFFERCLTN